MSDQQALAQAMRYSIELTTRYLAGFDEPNRTAQAPALPNHPVWILGHCGFTMARVAAQLDDSPVDESAFVADQPRPDGAFVIDSIAFASVPKSDASMYPTLARSRAIFEQSGERLASVIEAMSDAQLDTEIPWGRAGTPIAVGDLLVRLVFHNGTHAGQLTDLRRALKLDRVLG